MALWENMNDVNDGKDDGIWFGNRYKGGDAEAKADIKSFDLFKTQFGMLKKRFGEIGGEYDKREQFMGDQFLMEQTGINREGMYGVENAQNRAGGSNLVYGAGNKAVETVTSSFADKLRMNALGYAKSKFELGLQEKAESFGMQTNMLDLYSNFQSNRQNLEFDATGDFDINKQAGIV